jgi:hypothetical protein
MRSVRLAFVAALALAIASPVLAADEVFEGTLVCAMCGLKKADAKECQDVLLVADASGAKTEYYITKNEVAKEAGEACTRQIKATVTGTVSERDGKTWLTASKIEKQDAGEPHAHGQGHGHTP